LIKATRPLAGGGSVAVAGTTVGAGATVAGSAGRSVAVGIEVAVAGGSVGRGVAVSGGTSAGIVVAVGAMGAQAWASADSAATPLAAAIARRNVRRVIIRSLQTALHMERMKIGAANASMTYCIIS
jgi:hypothetical protein